MLNSSTVITVDDTTSAIISIRGEDNLGVLEFSNAGDDKERHNRVSLIFGEGKSIEILIDILKKLKERVEKSKSKIVVPDKKFIA